MEPLSLPQVPWTVTPVILAPWYRLQHLLLCSPYCPFKSLCYHHPPSLLPVIAAALAQRSVFFFWLVRRVSCGCWKVLAKAKTEFHGYTALNPFRVSVTSEPKGLPQSVLFCHTWPLHTDRPGCSQDCSTWNVLLCPTSSTHSSVDTF